jgi:hypothetical protein
MFKKFEEKDKDRLIKDVNRLLKAKDLTFCLFTCGEEEAKVTYCDNFYCPYHPANQYSNLLKRRGSIIS